MRMVRFGYGDEEENTDRQRDGIEEMEGNDPRTAGTEYSEGDECSAEEASGDAESETLGTGAECSQEEMGEGWIYFIETADGKFVKIGYSITPLRRVAQLGTLVPIRILGCFPGSMSTEAWLHRQFSAERMIGEWFNSTDELRALIGLLGPLRPIEDTEIVRPVKKKRERAAAPRIPGKQVMITVDVTELGKKGGKARAAAMTGEERSAASANAVNARWEAYYAAHPEKLEERKRRDAARAAAKKRKAKKAGKTK